MGFINYLDQVNFINIQQGDSFGGYLSHFQVKQIGQKNPVCACTSVANKLTYVNRKCNVNVVNSCITYVKVYMNMLMMIQLSLDVSDRALIKEKTKKMVAIRKRNLLP